MVSVGRRRVPVPVKEVEWFSSAGNYVVVNWTKQEGLIRETLRVPREAPPGPGFRADPANHHRQFFEGDGYYAFVGRIMASLPAERNGGRGKSNLPRQGAWTARPAI
jgi:hypothetical protein